MNNRYLIKSAIVLLVGIQLAACSSSTVIPVSHWERSNRDIEFDSATNKPPTPKTLCVMSRILASQGKDTECEYILQRILREHPNYALAYVDLAELQMRQQRTDDAIETLTAGLTQSPDDPILLNNLGMCLMVKNQHEEALSKFTQALSARPRDMRYKANTAVALGMMGHYDESLKIYQEVLGHSAQAHYNLAVLCEARGDYERSVQEYTRAAALDDSIDVTEDINRIESLVSNG